MKIRMLAVSLIGLRFICTALADDLPGIGYSVRAPVKDLVAKGYRWVTVDGPYACVSEQEVRIGATFTLVTESGLGTEVIVLWMSEGANTGPETNRLKGTL